MDVMAYARQLRLLLPRGAVWLLEQGSRLRQVLEALAEELARVEARGRVLLLEADPRTATETLPEWEEELGLPDEAVQTIPATAPERRLAVVSKLLRQGNQTPSFYVALAAACGYTVTIDDAYGLLVARAGRLRAGDRCYGTEWAHTWRVDVQPPAGVALSHAELEAILRRARPSHTAVIFEYL